jgi:diguanylate cyclase (GGDEF)-like protein
MIVLFVAVLGFSLIRTIDEANSVDTERTRAAVASAVQAQVQQIIVMADDNAIWDDAATAVYTRLREPEFFWSSWGWSSAQGKNFDTVLILDHEGQPLLGYYHGRPVRFDPAAKYGEPFSILLERAKRQKQAVGGLAGSPEGPVLIGLANIVPTNGALDRIVQKSGPYWLVFTKPFGQGAADRIGRSLLLKDMKLSDRPSGEAAMSVHDTAAKPIASLSWTPARPGTKALERALPWIAIASFLHLLIGALVGRNVLRSVAKLAEEAMVDSLSNLPNRRAMRRELDHRLKRGEKLALALIDLDGFKGINDNYGHHVGDRLIKSIAALLEELVGTRGMIARLGGDEFAVMVPGASAVNELQDIARAMLDKLSRPFRIDERTVLVGASIGMASVSLSDLDSSELMRRADVAMYSAKRAGKMRLAWYDEMLDQKQAIARTIEAELRIAIDTEDFDLVYQPVVGIHDKKIVAVEALLRWTSPTRGIVSPSEFIPVAEETGLIDRMGMIVLRRACRDALEWGDIRMAVNVSAAQLRNPEFATELSRVLAETKFPAERLELEITEAYLVYDPDAAGKVLNEIRALGVGVALDDYGTGHASIGFLRQFSFSKVKLDRSLVTDAGLSEEARTVIHANIAVARALNVAVAAEGVETEDQADMMRVAGCDQLQGWLFSRPVTAKEVAARVLKDYPEHASSRLRAV